MSHLKGVSPQSSLKGRRKGSIWDDLNSESSLPSGNTFFGGCRAEPIKRKQPTQIVAILVKRTKNLRRKSCAFATGQRLTIGTFRFSRQHASCLLNGLEKRNKTRKNKNGPFTLIHFFFRRFNLELHACF